MENSNISTVILIFLMLNIPNNEVSSQQVSISVYNTSSNNNVLAGLNGNLYVIIDQNSFFVDIICNKTSSFEGTLYVTINTEQLNNGYCTRYIPSSQQTDFTCLSKTYSIDITTLNSYYSGLNRIPIFCGITEDSSKYSIVDLIRLYTDNKPRARKGVILYDSLNIFDFYDKISCEAIADSTKSIVFDNVQWYFTNQMGNLVSFNMPPQSNKITSRITNYSIPLTLTASNPNLNSGSNNLKCCTTLGGTVVSGNCIDVLIQVNFSITTAPQTTLTTTTTTTTTTATTATTTINPTPTPTTVSTSGSPILTTITTKTSVTTVSSTQATTIISNAKNSTALPILTTTVKTGLTSDEIGIIVGTIVGATVLLALILLALCCYCTYLRKGKSSSATFSTSNNQQATVTKTPSKPKTKKNKPTKKSEKDVTKSQKNNELSFSYLRDTDVKNKKTIKKTNEDTDFIDAFN